jgi:hypothetical protein
MARLIVGLVVALAVAPAWVHAADVDPRSLVGEWSGTVTRTTANAVDVKYYLTIARAEGKKLFGKAQAIGVRPGPEYQIEGTIEGNVFKYHSADKDLLVELIVDGSRMTGDGVRQRSAAKGRFDLTKTK